MTYSCFVLDHPNRQEDYNLWRLAVKSKSSTFFAGTGLRFFRMLGDTISDRNSFGRRKIRAASAEAALNWFGDPNGTRTRVTALKGLCPNRWTMGPHSL